MTQDSNESHSIELTNDDFSVGWLCVLPIERIAATAMLDIMYPVIPKPPNDPNTYTLGSISKHNVVIACTPKGSKGNSATANTVAHMMRSFPSIKFGLMVGIGGGVPSNVRLGDVVVGTPIGPYPGVVQWDFGKHKDGKIEQTTPLNSPPGVLMSALTKLETTHEMAGSNMPEYLQDIERRWPGLAPKYAQSTSLRDHIYAPDKPGRSPEDARVHYGLIASANTVIKDAKARDDLNKSLGGGLLCVEMGAGGLIDFPCLVIRGICNYADSHANKDWREHAAAMAAAFAKELLEYVQPADVGRELPVRYAFDTSKQVQTNTATLVSSTGRPLVTDTSATKSDVTQISKLLGKEDIGILEWITQYDYGTQHRHHLGGRQSGTGRSFLASSYYQGWLVTSHHTLLCPKISEDEKETLASIITDDLRSRFSKNPEIGVAYICCSFQRKEEQNVNDVLASILKQLIPFRSSMPDSIKKVYDRHMTTGTRPSFEEIKNLLHSVVAMYSRVFIIVDTPFEGQAPDRYKLKFFVELFDLQTLHGINIFATSVFTGEIIEQCSPRELLEPHASSENLAAYLENHFQQLPSVMKKVR